MKFIKTIKGGKNSRRFLRWAASTKQHHKNKKRRESKAFIDNGEGYITSKIEDRINMQVHD